jgi:acyl-coenzyme A thioesterase PaaI-like protein
MDYQAIRAQINRSVPFAGHVKVEVTQVGAGTAEASLPEDAALQNHVGTQHAGALFTLAEAASGAAMVGSFPDLAATIGPVVKDAAIRYLKAARGPIQARATLAASDADIRAELASTGRADFKIDVQLLDQAGVEVANADFLWSMRKR